MSEDRSSSITYKYGFYIMIIIIAILISFVVYLLPISLPIFKRESVRIYYADNISEAHREAILKFNQKYKGKIEVIPVDLPFTKFSTNDRKEIIARALRTKSSVIDIFAVDQVWVERFSRWAEPLSIHFSRQELDRFIKPALNTCYNNRVLVSIPIYFDIGLLYYRKDLIKRFEDLISYDDNNKPFITWEILYEIKKRYYKDKPVYVFQGDNYEGLVCNFVEFFGGLGGNYQALQDFNFVDTTIIRTINFMKKLIDNGIAPIEVTEFNEIESWKYALLNDIPFFRGWPSFNDMYLVEGVETKKIENLDRTYVAFKKGNEPRPVIGGWNLMISKYSPHKYEAVTFIKYMVSEDSQWILRSKGGFLPVIKKLYLDEKYTSIDQELRFYYKYFNYSISRPSHINYTKISDVISSNINMLLRGELDVSEVPFIINKGIGNLLLSINH